MARLAGFLALAALGVVGVGARSSEAQSADSTIVITRDELLGTGRATLAEALQVILPSFNYPRPGGIDASDHSPPATYRGLGATHLVVRVDGARRHPGALAHPGSAASRGEVAPDLNAVPLAAIERVEIFTGVASSRLAPDGIAGVVNLVLARDLPPQLSGSLGLTLGGGGGGSSSRTAANYRLGWGGDGFLQLSGEYRVRGSINRARLDPREQFFPGDPRNDDSRYANRVHDRLGDPESRDIGAMARFGKPLAGGAELYGFLSGNRRQAESAALWRRPSDNGTVRSVYPNGFLPIIGSTIFDRSAQVGGRGRLGNGPWRWDLAAAYGASTVRFDIQNTANASLGPLSPTQLYAGTLGASRLAAAIEITGTVPIAIPIPAPLAVSAGAEVRSEGYRIEAGERDSYRYGAVPILDGPGAGGIAPLGAQGFPGFMPGDGVHRRREIVAGYAELGATPIRRLRVLGTGRIERYGSENRTLTSATTSARFEPVAGVLARGSAGFGFRAPSLAEQWYSRSTVPIVNQIGLFDLLVPRGHPIADSLGLGPLRSERSAAWSAGIGARLGDGRFTLDADYYRIVVRNRITLTGKFDESALRAVLESKGFIGVGAVQFFANTADTRTTGYEIRAGYAFAVSGIGVRLTGAFDHHRVRVEQVDSATGFLRQYPSSFFPASERARIESGQPGDNAALSATITGPAWTVRLRARRYGAVRDFGPAPDGTLAQTFGAKWLGDVELSHRLRPGEVTLAAGAHNLLGTYPDQNRQGDPTFEGNSYFGIFPYNRISPFGFAGRFIYARAEWRP